MWDKITVTDISDVCTVFQPKGRRLTIERRAWYGLTFSAGGVITYTHNGQEFVSDSAHAVLLPKGQTYRLRCDRAGSFPVINFLTAEPIGDKFLSMPIGNSDAFLHKYDELLRAFCSDNRAKAMSLLYEILHLLHIESVPQNPRLREVAEFMRENFSDSDLSNARLAAMAGVSEVHFRTLFKEVYGQTPHRYLTGVRMTAAKRLLAEQDIEIGRVAEACGFSGVYHFCRAFKNAENLTPTEYRRRAGHRGL